MTDQLPGMGDNLPPKEFAIGEAITTYLKGIHHRLVIRRDELIGAEARVPALPLDKDDAEAERAVTEYLRQIASCTKTADNERVAAKEPYLDGGRRVDTFFKAIMEPMAKLDGRIRPKLTAYKAAVEKRERERLEAEAKAAEAAAVDDATLEKAIEAEELTKALSTDLTRARSAYGAQSSLSYVLEASWDRKALDLEALRDHFTEEALEKAVRAYMRTHAEDIKVALKADPKNGGTRIKGVSFFMAPKTNIR